MYKIGQKLVCIIPEGDNWIFNGNIMNGPKNGDVVTCDGSREDRDMYIFLTEYNYLVNGLRSSFASKGFAPIQGRPAIKELAQRHTITLETCDIPNVQIPKIA